MVAAAYSRGQQVMEPAISANSQCTRIRHRELIATVNGAVSFSASGYYLNPGLSATFPWLSTQAAGWEQYRFRKLKFEFVTRCGSTTTGSVLLVPDYDALDAPPSTEAVAATYRGTIEDVPWKDMELAMDMNAAFAIGPRKYIRNGLVVTSDLKTYDAGQFFLCVTGMADTSAVGKLWVEYDVELSVPQTVSSGLGNPLTFAQYNLSASQGLTTGTVATLNFDEVVVNALGITNQSGAYVLPAGNWQISAEVTVSGGTSATQSLVIEFQKDGSALSQPCQSWSNASGTVASAGIQAVATCFIQSSGSTQVRLRVTYTSAAGTLVAYVDSCRIMFRPC